MELKDRESFAILLCNEVNDENSIISISQKIGLRKHIPFNRIIINGQRSYVLYNVKENKQYIFNFGSNKKLKFVWKDKDDFYIIDFSNNSKGDIISHLTFEETSREKFEGNIEYPNIKKEFQNVKRLPLFCSAVLDDDPPLLYEHFTFYIKNTPSEDSHN